MSGATSYHGGLAAEEQVADHYRRLGMTIAARRWRGRCGEIDLIARDGAAVVCVEVKRAATHAAAAERVSAHQRARICAAASEFIAFEPAGQDTDLRFNVALVDGAGHIEVIENAFDF
ncbi:MAG: YraN family protein [Rhodobacteraceae bacterium]|nr:YraN family protein [Paracoccaceae bacterium]